MDPKALDHLDPKQKEAYDRIMGHADGTSELSASPDSTPPDPTSGITTSPADFAANLDTFSTNPNSTPISDFNSSPLDTPLDASSGDQPQFYTPGQETSHDAGNAIPSDPNQLSSQLTDSPSEAASFLGPDPATPGTNPLQPDDNLAPPNSSFFTNTSPAETTPSGMNEGLNEPITPAEPEGIPASSPDNFAPGTPVTPYTPSEVPNLAPATGAFAQPLQSPASVAQEANKEASPLVRVLYIIGAVTFFAIYTIFWIKVFNLPFLF